MTLTVPDWVNVGELRFGSSRYRVTMLNLQQALSTQVCKSWPSMGSWCIRLTYTVARQCVFSLARYVRTHICYNLTPEVLTWKHRLLLSVHVFVMAARAWCKLRLCKLRGVADETRHLVKKYYAYPNSACDWVAHLTSFCSCSGCNQEAVNL